jgi:hypothetical protein
MTDIGFFEGIVRDLGGKGQFRLFLQPAMALLLGVRLGLADAKEGKDPFLFRLFRTSQRPWKLLQESLWDAVIPLGIAIAIDSVLQYMSLGFVRPIAAVFVAGLLVWLPFSLSRGLTNRWWTRSHVAPSSARAGPRHPA